MRTVKALCAGALGIAVVCATLGGCGYYPTPLSMSMSKFVHDPEDPAPPGGDAPAAAATAKKGRVGVGTGLAIIGVEDNESTDGGDDALDTSLYLFPVEGGGSFWLHRNYDLTVSLHSGGMLALEGVVTFPLGGARLGLIHGVGLGLMGQDPDGDQGWNGFLQMGCSAGAVLQFDVSRSGSFFLGAKYAFSHQEPVGDEGEDEEDEALDTHFATVGLGYAVLLGSLRLTPEFAFAYGSMNTEGVSRSVDLWYFVPSISLAGAF
ncbi:MAG TPA: hypothetical protein PK668_10250 [Myxococcota bacterium]|nr:hypothetical protein [Myxococcota bacterium]HRY93452.1 hypothetical protein [Myxococcota bacterium]HSA20299.1 hypothetical protein [Myxococcota bacterium]